MSELQQENFELSKLKSLDRESVEFEGYEVMVDGPDTHRIKIKKKMPITPSPDLFHHLDQLKEIVWSYFGWGSIVKVTEDRKFQSNAEQKRLIAGTAEVLKNNIRITGVTFAGKDRDKLVVTSSINGCAINTKALGFSNPEYGEAINDIADALEEEVWEYAFNGKRHQLSMAFDGEEPVEKPTGKDAAAGE